MLLAYSGSLAFFNKDGNTFYLTYSSVFLVSALVVNIFIISEEKKNKFDFYNLFLISMLFSIILQPLIFYIYDIKLFGHILDSYIAIFTLYILSRKYWYLYNEEFILKTILIFSLCNSIFAFAQYITGKPLNPSSPYSTIVYNVGYGDLKRVSGFIGSNNGAGNLGAILFTPLLYFLVKKPSFKTLVPFVFNLIFTILTFTRIGYVSIGVQILVFFIFSNRYKIKAIKRTRVVVIAISIMIMLYAAFNFESTVNALFASRGDTQQSRIDQFKRCEEIIKSEPILGIGYGNYIQYAVNIFSEDDIIIHSQYIGTFVESGAIGMILFLIINIVPIVLLLKKYDKNKWVIINIFLGNLIVCNFNPNQYYYMNVFIYFYIIFNLYFFKGESQVEIEEINTTKKYI
jgi:O-antigen ligase